MILDPRGLIDLHPLTLALRVPLSDQAKPGVDHQFPVRYPGDILLVEAIDRLSRLPQKEWTRLRAEIEGKGLRVVALDLPTSHKALSDSDGDEFTALMLDAVNRMMLDMLAAIARKDYEQRRDRQAQGIAKAKDRGVYKGRPVDQAKHDKIRQLLDRGFSVRKTAELAGAAPSTVQRVKQDSAA